MTYEGLSECASVCRSQVVTMESRKGIQMKLSNTMAGLTLGLCVLLLCSGCVSSIFPGGPTPAGGIITSVRSPAQNLTVATDASASSTKVGTSSAGAVLGLFAFGDASMNAAMNDGGIRKVHHVDHEVNTFLFGVWVQNKTIVHGE